MRKRGIGIALIVIVILLIILAGILIFANRKDNSECKVDSDCVKVQTGCCPCSSGGEEKCVSKLEADKYTTKCEGEVFCAQVYNCNIEKCICAEGKCAG